jgi:hypothetical protein
MRRSYVQLHQAQAGACALALALPSAGNNMLARIAMLAMTTRNPIHVNPPKNSTWDT